MYKFKQSVPYLAMAVLIVFLDQIVKKWVQGNIPLYGTRAFLPGVVELTYWKNTGAAFSILENFTWLLAIISAVVAIALLAALIRGVFPHVMGRIALALLLGGAVGNLIDRVFLGYVVDMFHLQFMNFAVFNVADIGVTVGGVLLCVYLLFFWNKEKEAVA